MLRALLLGFGQLTDPASRRVVWLSVLGAVVSFAALLGVVSWALTSTVLTSWSWVDTAIDVMGGVLVVALAWLLFPAVVATLASFLLEEVVRAVERRHYPHLGEPLKSSVAEEVGTALRFLAVVVLVNLVALPLYLAVPGVNLVLYYAVNGYLLGREYFEMVANRRMRRPDAALLRKSRPLKPFLAGVAIAFLSTLPLLNLFAPVIASAFMVHVFQSMNGPLRAAGRA
ncbi:MAG TPA: EI24 domain-containing protein [Azospirillum sp.]|nr:EI24 domain-containing protein [Azospirillum sp.]